MTTASNPQACSPFLQGARPAQSSQGSSSPSPRPCSIFKLWTSPPSRYRGREVRGLERVPSPHQGRTLDKQDGGFQLRDQPDLRNLGARGHKWPRTHNWCRAPVALVGLCPGNPYGLVTCPRSSLIGIKGQVALGEEASCPGS